MFKQLLLLLTLLCWQSLQKGKTYEDYAELIRESHELHIPADIEQPQTQTPTTQVHENQKVEVKEKTVIKTPPTYSTNEVTNIDPTIVVPPKSNVQTPSSNKVAQPSQQQQPVYKEKYDDPSTLSHAKFHTHGQGESADYEKAKQIVLDSNKKKKQAPSDSVSLRNVGYTNVNYDNKEQLYFLLSVCALFLTALLIISAAFAGIYVCYRFTFGNRERYFQFDDNVSDNEKRSVKIDQLSKIEEAAAEDEELESHNSKITKDEPASKGSNDSRQGTQDGESDAK